MLLEKVEQRRKEGGEFIRAVKSQLLRAAFTALLRSSESWTHSQHAAFVLSFRSTSH